MSMSLKSPLLTFFLNSLVNFYASFLVSLKTFFQKSGSLRLTLFSLEVVLKSPLEKV